jgi:hypothetical protein
MLKINTQKPSLWQRVFLQSKVNGAVYCGDQLPGMPWSWPTGTYLQRRLKLAPDFRKGEERDFN